MRFLASIVALACFLAGVVLAVDFGFTATRQILTYLLLGTGFAYYAAQRFAYERKKQTNGFLSERARLEDLFRQNETVEGALSALEPSFKLTLDQPGVTSRGPCRIVCFMGSDVHIRLEVRGSKISDYTILPLMDKGVNKIAATLKTDIVPKPPDLTQRDWMGNPRNLK